MFQIVIRGWAVGADPTFKPSSSMREIGAMLSQLKFEMGCADARAVMLKVCFSPSIM